MSQFGTESPFTKTIIGPEVFTVTDSMGVVAINVKNDSASTASVSIVGSRSVAGQDSDAIPLGAGEVWGATSESVAITGITISVPSGAVAYISMI